MRVLIVDAFSIGSEGRRSFNNFKTLVKKAFTFQKMYNVEDIEFIEVDHSSIDTYLYELNAGFSSKDAEKLFDHLDFVFIDGDSNLLPWLQHTRKFLTLIRMCKKTKKILFAASFAMQTLVFLCATSFNVGRVINGKGRGSSLHEIHNLPRESLSKLSLGDVFLDNSTGDIFCYDGHRNEFYPVANAGLHNNKAAQENEKVSKAILRTYKYSAKNVDKIDEIYIGKSTETKVRIFKQFVQHWLLKGVGFDEFLVPNLNKWDVHPINATLKENVLSVLAESQRGPQIIVHNNAVGVQFHVSSKYPMTFLILKNFVVHMMDRFQNEKDKFDLPLHSVTKAGFYYTGFGASRNGSQDTQNANDSEKYGLQANEARHSGFAFSLRNGEPLTVKINSTTSQAIKLKKMARPRSQESFDSSFSDNNSMLREPVKRTATNKKVDFALKRTLSSGRDQVIDNRIIRPIDAEYANSLGSQVIESLPEAWKSKKEIRSLLHPGYATHLIPKRGNILNGTNLTLTKNDYHYYEKPVVRVTISPKFYCRYNREFKEKESQELMRTRSGSLGATLRNDGTPYIEPDKLKRQEEIREKSRWMDKRDFHRVFSESAITRQRANTFNSLSSIFNEK
ncbi:unnamed protein product [Blepharisma stoltei]|uniref:Uncharacterized protein n=1 Tax=Blepharisma stoltei TaxID=1481888 RepID=A0AAU9JHA0_9CILI|nr:unnamed protein product [Blepharisma stoltei]